MSRSPTDLLAVLEHNRARLADVELFRFLGRGEDVTDTWTYAGLHDRALQIAGDLQACTAVDDRVVLVFAPGLELVVAFVGTILAGRVPVVCTPQLPKDLPRLQAVFANAQPAHVLCGDALLATLTQALAAIGAGVPVRALAAVGAGGEPWRHPGDRASATAFLQYTSGSTARPKGVVITHANLLHNLQQIQRKFATTADDLAVVWLPPYHDMGLIGGILQPLFVGLRMVLMPPMHFVQRPVRWLRAVSRFGATITGGPNFALQACVDRIAPHELAGLSLASLRLLFSGAERVRPATLAAFARAFGGAGFDAAAFYPCYGLAESTLMAAGGRAGAGIRLHRRAGDGTEHVGCGDSIDGQQLRIVAPATAAPLADGEVGEILVASPSVTPGYHRDAEANAQLFVTVPDAAGAPVRMLRTGDLGYLHEGVLYVTGRCKEVLIVRGRTYHPQDLEELVESVDPALVPHGVACFAVDDGSTEGLVVYCEVRRGRLRDLPQADVVAAIQGALGRVHGLAARQVVFVDERALPRTTSGKLMRLELRRRHLAGEVAPSAAEAPA